ncbi:hypothetical protein MMC13_003985 [Lambiella insularis]|nr:hypothetical protein [Lambiella insularis]
MFSPDAPVGSSIATRNPRRRQRTISDDSVALRPSTKRQKRSLLAPDTFAPLTNHKSNGHSLRPTNGHLPATRVQRDVSVDTTSLAIRNRTTKRVEREKRSSKHEDGVVQTKNDNYIVAQDPSIPHQLEEILKPWHADISSSLGHAVATTHTQAIIWCCASVSSAIDVSSPAVLKLPYQSTKIQSPSHPLPLGILVHDSGAGEIALLIVMPLTGQVTYWESVKEAANSDPVRQKQQVLHGSVGGLLSGETITKVTETEPDGFVLTASTGRVIYLTVRDPQGRPVISTQFLRGSTASTKGLLGSITSVFSAASWRKDIAAVRAGPVQGKSHRLCIIATTQGVFQMWDLARHSSKSFLFEIDAKDEIFGAIQKTNIRQFADGSKNNLEIIDFAIFSRSDVKSLTVETHRILVLTFIKEGQAGTYNLIDLSIENGTFNIDVVHPISCYSEGPHAAESWNTFKPQVLLPEPAQTAFVVFDKSIVLISLAQIEESPSSQLRIESHTLPDPFQDTLYLRQYDHNYHVVGCCPVASEKDSGNATCTFLIHGFGMARITVFPPKNGQSALERSTVTIKSKMEQAIFFGNMPRSLLDFDPERSKFKVQGDEVEVATLDINDSIMRSTSAYIPAVTPSMEHQLRLRATALAALIKYASRWPLKAATRWELLWSAEKMAAGIAVWQAYSAQLSTGNQEKKSSLLPELLDMLHGRWKKELRPERGETDIVRHYLINDIWQIELVIPWAQKAVEELYTEGIQGEAQQIKLVSQANDIQIGAMEAAFGFRSGNAEVYGFGKDVIKDGIYQGDYSPFPEIWTSIPEIVSKVKELVDLSREMAINLSDSLSDAIDIVEKVAKDNPRLIHICCQVYEERCRWLKARADAKSKADGEALALTYQHVRRDLIIKVADLELPDEAIKLAEMYRDMPALVDVLERSTLQAMDRLVEPGLSDNDEDKWSLRIESNRERIEQYFTTYGAKWADALYSKNVSQGALADLFDNVGGFQSYLTRYLRGKPEYAKLSWINEVLAEQNFAKAADNLLASHEQEANLWSKKIQLSLGKLTLLAAREKTPAQVKRATAEKKVSRCNGGMEMISIQEQLYAYIRPSLIDAVDEDAKLDIVVNEFGLYATKSMPTLRSILERGLLKLVARRALDAEELIETMTLISEDARYSDEGGFADRRFFLALKVLSLTGLEKKDRGRYELYQKVVWRRCMLQDDWKTLNQTEAKSDEEVAFETGATALFRTLKAGFEEGTLDFAQPIPPSAVLTAGTSVESLRRSGRFAHWSDSALRALAQDLGREDRTLEEHLEQGRLEMWWSGIVDAAKASVRADADNAGAAMAEREKTKGEVAAEIGLGEAQEQDVYSKGYDNRSMMDEQGDTVMG